MAPLAVRCRASASCVDEAMNEVSTENAAMLNTMTATAESIHRMLAAQARFMMRPNAGCSGAGAPALLPACLFFRVRDMDGGTMKAAKTSAPMVAAAEMLWTV